MRKLRRAEAGLSACALHSGKAHQSFPRGGQLQGSTGAADRGRHEGPGQAWPELGEEG